MRKRNKIILGGFGTIVIIFMVAISIILNGIILKQSIENQKSQEKINELKETIENQINELAIDSINTKLTTKNNFESISENLDKQQKQIGELKLTTDNDLSVIVENAMPAIVAIRTLYSQGSGFFVKNNGYIATNKHILLSPNNDLSAIIQIITADGKIHLATLIGSSEKLDLAVLKIDSSYKSLEFENSEDINIGDPVLTIGNPEGLAFSVTDGIISAKNRIGLNDLPNYIQTNTELNKGNSGSPLISKKGKVIGINNFKIAETEGLGFALESSLAKKAIFQIIKEHEDNQVIQ